MVAPERGIRGCALEFLMGHCIIIALIASCGPSKGRVLEYVLEVF